MIRITVFWVVLQVMPMFQENTLSPSSSPEDGGNMFLQTTDNYLPHYMML
jgi:hypothetical protein